jgi:1,4-dihydroxy-2-naphthoate octaprenyltransferase
VRPPTLAAAIAPVLVGTALAARDGAADLLPALFAALGALLIQIFTNLYNDVADFRRGADTAARLGPDRVTERGWATPAQMMRAAVLVAMAAVAVGIYLATVGGWPILAIGAASLVAGYLYTGGPWPLAYLGLGDVFVFLFFGEVAVVGTYYLLTQTVSAAALLCGAVVGLATTAILVVNNLRDAGGDAAAGKRTLVVRFGDRFGRFEFAGCLFGGYVLVVIGALTGALPGAAALVFLGLPLALLSVRRLWGLSGAALNPELGAAARHGLWISVLLASGVLL